MSAIASKLDARFPELQDSCALLAPASVAASPLEQLQRRRTATTLHALLGAGKLAGFRPPSLRSPLLGAAGACLGLALYVGLNQLAPATTGNTQVVSLENTVLTQHSAGAIVEARTLVEPPAYTGLTASQQSLHIEAPELSQITWQLTLDAPVFGMQMIAARKNYSLFSLDPLPSRRWTLTRTLRETDFYQLRVLTTQDSADADYVLWPEIYNLEVIPDRAPEFSFDYPKDSVTVVNVPKEQQSSLLEVSVQVSDDFGVQHTDLLLTLASGSGENVRFRNERIRLEPVAVDGTQQRYRFSIPVQRYEIEPGDELYWFLESRDNRAPDANIRKSQHFIVRWPQEEIFGLSDAEGMAIKILPEYFRSQRQLIIDTEALLEDRESISTEAFRERSTALAYEQNLLRMRYGRFLGEEDSAMEHGDEHQDKHADPHAGAASEGQTDGQPGGHTEDHAGEDAEHHTDSHLDRDAPIRRFGDASGVVAAAGHQHDSSEHATLFDPATKELLRSALNAMWSAWRDLSVIEPHSSLPYQHTALRCIKEVQQASRIYLQRVGFDAPPLDESRRLSGEQAQKAPPRVSAEKHDSNSQQLKAALDMVANGQPIADSFTSELETLPALRSDHATRVELAKQLRRYRQQPACEDCRRELSAQLYQLLPTPQAEPVLPDILVESGSYSSWLRQRGEKSQ